MVRFLMGNAKPGQIFSQATPFLNYALPQRHDNIKESRYSLNGQIWT